MKKSRLFTVLLLVVAVVCSFAAVGCGETTPVTYSVTVTGGTADKATAAAGETITLTPDAAPAGSEFKGWTVNGTAIDANTFTMSAADAVVKAVYNKLNYTVTVTDGTADKANAQLGDTVTLTPGTAPAGSEFSHWTVNGKTIEGNKFTMTAADATVAAVFKKIDYTVTVTNGTADKQTAQLGDTVTLTPGTAPEGSEFAHWTVNGQAIEGNSFVMTAENAVVKAVYNKVNYAVTVTNGTADKQTAQLGDTVTLAPCPAPEGKAFFYWTVNGAKITGNTFTMTAGNATVEAVYIDLVQKIATPDNSAGELIFAEKDEDARPCPVALDRAANKTQTMFTDATDYVKFYIYDSTAATEPLGAFKMVRGEDNESKMGVGTLTSLDGTVSIPFNGEPKNYYFDTVQWNGFFNILKHELGYNYSEGRAYYFAAQVIAVSTPVNVDGFDITYTDSDISVIGAKSLTKDASQSGDKFTVTVKEGKIDGDKTTVDAGYGVTLTLMTEAKENFTFTGWYLTDGEGNAVGDAISRDLSFVYTVTGNANIIAEFIADADKVKLDTPDNTESKLILKEKSDKRDSAIALDRVRDAGDEKVTMFTANTEYVVYYVYDAADAAKPIGSFKIRTEFGKDPASGTAMVGWVETMDGGVSEKIVRGSAGDYYIDGSNANQFYAVLKAALGYEYGEGRTFFFAAQAFAYENSRYANSDISAIGSVGFAIDQTKPADKFAVTVLDGIIDGDKTTVTAGYGVTLKLTAEMPADKDIFKGWTVITMDGETEVEGEILSADLTFVMIVTADVTLRPVFLSGSETEVTKLAAPDNTKNQMIVFNGAIIEYDRQKDAEGNSTTAFNQGVAYLLVYVYTAPDAEPVPAFKIVKGGDKFYLSALDDHERRELSGEAGNLYSSTGDYHNLIKACVAKALGETSYNNDASHYYAFQAIAASGLYSNSDIGPMGQSWGAI